MLARWLNTVWKWKCAGEAAAFQQACGRVAHTQEQLLFSMLAANRETVFGLANSFDRIRTTQGFQRRVPVSTYHDYQEYVARIAVGESGVLTRERVLLLEPTSGTTSGEKLIPYTRSLRQQFQRGIAAWIADLFQLRPAAARGRAYWSISPALGKRRRTTGGIPIGFDDDAAYLGRFEQWALRHVLAVPSAVARSGDLASVRHATLLHLLAARDLSLISIWSPTFLTSLLAPLRAAGDALTRDLRQGSPRRADEVASLLRSVSDDAELFQALWPKLALISCWTDAAAGYFVPMLRQLFPHVEIQPKGLLATEGFVSLPVAGQTGSALAVRSHFFEFVEPGDNQQFRLAHELQLGGRYRVLLTTGGGLYRYDLGDEVEVTGFLQQCPTLRFCGRDGRTSDLVGEKLSEAHVAAALDAVFTRLNVRPNFVLLAPVLGSPPHYRLYLQGATAGSHGQISEQLEERLAENPYYRHALEFQQLASLEVVLLDTSVPAWPLYEQDCLQRGQRAGNIKPAVLDRGTHWPEVFAPATVVSSAGPLAHAR